MRAISGCLHGEMLAAGGIPNDTCLFCVPSNVTPGSYVHVAFTPLGGGPQHAQRRRDHRSAQRRLCGTHGDREVLGAVRRQRERCRQRRLVSFWVMQGWSYEMFGWGAFDHDGPGHTQIMFMPCVRGASAVGVTF